MKRILIILAYIVVNARVAVAQVVGGLNYRFSGAYATVIGVASDNTSEKIVVPSTITYKGLDYTVTKIGTSAFSSTHNINSNFKTIVLPNTIEIIDQYAFDNENITNVKLNEGITKIGNYAFVSSSITNIIIPASLTEMGSSPLACNMLRTIIYLGDTPPSNWTATSFTYVPNKTTYSSPSQSINNANVMEMITFSQNTFTYTGHSPKLQWTNNVDGYTATLSIPTLNPNTGIYNIVIPATFSNGEETFTVNIPYTYTITPSTIKAKVANASRIYGDPNPDFSISYSGFVNGENESVVTQKAKASTTATNTSEIGTYPITIKGAVAKNYTFEYQSGVLSITQAPLTATVNDEIRTYGSANPNFSFKYSGLKNNETIPVWSKAPVFSTTATMASEIGQYPVTAECTAKNYYVTINPGTLTINPAALTIKANDAERLYFDAEPSLSYKCVGLKNNETSAVLTKEPLLTVDANMSSDVGTYPIIPSGATAKNYEISYDIGILTIQKKTLTVKPYTQNRLYGDPNPEYTFGYSGFVNGEDEDVLLSKPTASTTATLTSSVGSYPITASGGDAKNYKLEYIEGTLTVSKAPLSVKVNDVSKVYGGDNPEFSLAYTGLKNNEVSPAWVSSPQFMTEATKSSDAGTYEVTVACDPKNYYISSNTSGTLTINQALLTIKANDLSKVYYSSMPEYTYSYNGFVNGDDDKVLTKKPVIVTDAKKESSVGTYSIMPAGAEAKNYSIAYEPGTLTVTPKDLVVRANSANRLYGENNPRFILSYEGFVANETKEVLEQEPQVSTTATPMSNVGTYDIKVSGGKATNYTFTYKNGLLTIEPRELIASVGNYTRTFGEENPTFTVLYDGLVGNDTESSLNPKPVVRTNATKTSDVGEYKLDVTGGYSPNYNLSYKSGKLTIVQAEQSFEWNQDLSNVEAGSQVELTAKASSGLPVTYMMDENKYAEIYKAGSKTYLDCKSAGSFSIKAVQEGGNNYYSTQRINKKVTIYGESDYEPTLIIKQADNGSISTKVAKGSTYTFTVHCENGWKIHSVMFNDVDMTGQLDDNNSFTTPSIESASTLNVSYVSTEDSRVNEARISDYRIMPTSYGAKVTGTDAGDIIYVYTTDGVLQQTVIAESAETNIKLTAETVYIIKVGDVVVKLRK